MTSRNFGQFWTPTPPSSLIKLVKILTDAILKINMINNVTDRNTGGPRYVREIGTPKIGSHIMNLNIKRPRITIN